jgi:hypothetical protein
MAIDDGTEREDVASRIRALRGTRPQPQIADEVEVTLPAYQGCEAGGGIAWPNLRKLAEVHRVSTNWLEHGTSSPNAHTRSWIASSKSSMTCSHASAR